MADTAGPAGPLTASDAALLERSNLTAMESHQLRLLAHSLRTLQEIAGRCRGPAPTAPDIVAWARGQTALATDPGFRAAFCQQLLTSAVLLAGIADDVVASSAGEVGPLGLEIEQLVAWCEQRRAA